jgi:hypothetical protein
VILDRSTERHIAPWRRVILFALGVAVIVDAMASAGQQLGQLIVGLVLVGLVPVDEFLSRLGRH